MEKLSLVLWQERELLETLLFRLEVEQLVLAHGRTGWLMRAAREVEGVLETLREIEVLRSVAATEACEALGLPADTPLREVAAHSDEPWRTTLMDHHEAFTTITRQVIDMADANRHLITSGYRSARETLLSLAEQAPESYSPDGTAVAATPGARLIDRSL